MGKFETCASKRKYNTYQEAHVFALNANKNRHKKCTRNVYQCTVCSKFHITSMKHKAVIKRKIMIDTGHKIRAIFDVDSTSGNELGD
jgi:5-methylcytosine-specific restriction endonuclease McrA